MHDDITVEGETDSTLKDQKVHNDRERMDVEAGDQASDQENRDGFAYRTMAQIKNGRLVNRDTRADETPRRRRRYRIRKYINCTTPAFGGLEGQMVNVSEVGVMLRSRQAIEIGENVEQADSILLTVLVSDQGRTLESKVRLEAVPVWCTQKGEDGFYEMGFEWCRLSLPKRLMIKHWQRYCADQL